MNAATPLAAAAPATHRPRCLRFVRGTASMAAEPRDAEEGCLMPSPTPMGVGVLPADASDGVYEATSRRLLEERGGGGNSMGARGGAAPETEPWSRRTAAVAISIVRRRAAARSAKCC